MRGRSGEPKEPQAAIARFDGHPVPHRERARAMKKTSWFSRFAKSTARETGKPITFAGAVAIIVLWGVSGPLFAFSDPGSW
jgi:hypothetical protein